MSPSTLRSSPAGPSAAATRSVWGESSGLAPPVAPAAIALASIAHHPAVGGVSHSSAPGPAGIPALTPAGDRQLRRRPGATNRRGSGFLGKLEVALGQVLDINVLELHDPDVLHEPGRAVHVPDPRVVHGDLEEHLTVVGRPDLEVHVVGEIEPALGLNHVREEPDDVAVLAIELQLHLGLVLLEILRAHVLPSAAAGASGACSVPSALPSPDAVAGGSAINSPIGPSPHASIPSHH